MIYAQPGTAGAIVSFKPRYGNFIGGEFVAPVKRPVLHQHLAGQRRGRSPNSRAPTADDID